MPDSSKTFGKLTIPLLVLLAISFSALPAYAKYGGGKGEPNDPYQIGDANHMQAIGADSNDWDKHFKLIADIDLGGYTGTSFNIIGNFRGIFDGNGHTISNFTYSSTGTDYIGLFRLVDGEDAEIKDLGLIDPNVDAGTESCYVGSLVGSLYDGTITNSYVKGGSITADTLVGGLVGSNDPGGTISNCYSTGSVSGENYVGGLVGDNFYGTISNCYSTGSVSGTGKFFAGGLVGGNAGTITNCYSTASVSGDYSVGGLVGVNAGTITNCYSEGSVSGNDTIGGLVGYNTNATITNCYSTGNVAGTTDVGGLVGANHSYGTITNCYSSGDVSGGDDVGGLVGCNFGNISDCYATGSVSGNEEVGGLVGDNGGTITDCYATGSVTGTTDVGGLMGFNDDTITNSYWDIETSGEPNMCGSQDPNGTGCDNANGKTTAEMQTASTFTDAGWDFVGETANGTEDIWKICEGEDYPRLSWEKYGGGTGESNNPYLIYTSCQMNAIGADSNDWDKHFILMADIDLGGFTGTSFNIIGYYDYNSFEIHPFTGVFDGNDHTISNFTYTSPDTRSVGLFGSIYGENAEIKDLGLLDPNVDAGTGDCAGLLVGTLGYRSSITGCYVEAGGVSGSISAWLGGVGGLVGQNSGTISNCYSSSSVTATSAVGGLVGYNFYGTITNSYATGSVSGNEQVGGLVGYDKSGSYTKSFWDNTVNSLLTGIGNTTDPNVIGESTTDMQKEITFTDADWDFVGETANGTDDIWTICEAVDYPKLKWQFVIGDFDGDDNVDFTDFAIFATRWMETDSSFYCGGGGTDLTNDANVDINDLKEFADNWLAGL